MLELLFNMTCTISKYNKVIVLFHSKIKVIILCVTLLLFYVQIDKKKYIKKKELSYDVAELKIRLVHINKGIIPKYIYIYI